MADVFHAGQVQIPNPVEAIGTHKGKLARGLAALGTLGLLTCIASFALTRAGVLPASSAGAAAFYLIASLACLGWSLKLFLDSKKETRTVVLPPNAPGGYWEGELFRSLHDRILHAYQLPTGLLRRLQRRWGTNALFATKEEQRVAESSLNLMFVTVGSLFALLLFGTPIAFLGANPLTVGLGVLGCVGAGVLLVQQAAFRWGLVRRLVAETAPQCQPEERLDTVNGGGDPFILYADLEQRLLDIRVNRIPNRLIQRTGWDGSSAHISETGRFDGLLIIENQPVSSPRPTPTLAVNLLERSHLPLLVGAALAVVCVPGANVATALTLIGAGSLVTYVGWRNVSDSFQLCKKFRWESTALLLMAEGSTGKSEIRAGRGHEDSFESTNTVIRSDGKYRWYAGKVVSENSDAAEPRLVTAVLQDTDSHRVLDITAAALAAFRDKGVRIQQIDFQDKSVENVLKANVLATKAKASAKKGLVAPRPEVVLAEKAAAPSLGFCTSCGRPKAPDPAKFCGNCGMKF